MKICGLTQTYGDRNLELDVFLLNTQKIQAMNSVDHFRLNYHNSILNKKYNDLFSKQIKNISFKNYDQVPYGYTIYSTLKELKNDGYTDILYMQDDHYFIQHQNSSVIVNDVINFYKSNNYPIVYFGQRFSKNSFNEESKKTEFNTYEIYDSTSFPSHFYPYDDSPHLANIDFLLNTLYNPSMVHLDVWSLEIKNTNYFKSNKIYFASGTKPCSYCANFSGRNVAMAIPQQEKIKYILGEKIDYDECKIFYDGLMD